MSAWILAQVSRSRFTGDFRVVLAAFLLAAFVPAAMADPPPGYYDSTSGLTGPQLKAALHEIIDDHQRFPYTSTAIDTWDILAQADEDPDNNANVRDVYKNRSFPKGDTDGTVPDGWNREHVWPKSYGFPNDNSCNYPYTDCHSLKACDPGYNSSRNNHPFDYAPGGTAYAVLNTSYFNFLLNGRWETWQNKRGDVARAILYMDVRYEGGSHGVTGCAEPDLRVTDDSNLITVTSGNSTVGYMGILTTILEWHLDDPVDINERQRNDLVYTYQGNRNPFIDHPEFACAIYGGECPGGGDTTPPAAPASLTATGGDGSVSLDWPDNGEPDLSGYDVYRSTTAGGPYTKINAALLSLSSYVDTTVNNGTTYYYTVKAVDTSSNASASSPEASATPSGTPPPPTNLRINEAMPAPSSGSEWVEIYNPGSSAVDLTGWRIDDIIGAGSSPVNLSGTIAAGGFHVVTFGSAILNNTGDDINLIDPSSNVIDTTTYGSAPSGQSWARSVDGTGPFAWDATPTQGASNNPVTLPSAPSGLSATAASTSQINLSWADNSNNEDNFIVGRGTTTGGPYTDIATLGANTTSYNATGLSAGTTYYFVVRASNAAGSSANSSQASATTLAPPAAPSGLSATAAGTSQIDLLWTDNSGNETNFVVGQSTTSGGPYTDIATLGANVTNYSATGLNASTTYYYVVRATNANGSSTNSNQASATTAAPSSPLKINEAMPAPSSGSEWVEIYNTGTSAVDLTGWKLDDIIGGGSSAVNLSGSIPAGGFHVVTFGTAILNNTGDEINLINPSGGVVDSTTYGSAPSDQSWARSVDGTGAFAWDATPSQGLPNNLSMLTVVSVASEDGWVLESGENTNTGGSNNSSNSTILIGDNKNRRQYVGVLSFDTSALPDTATIYSATLQVTRNSLSSNPYATLGSLNVDIKSGALGASTALANEDFAAAAGADAVATIPQPSANNVTVSADISGSGLGHVNKTGKTQMKLRFANDDDNDSTADNLSIYSGSATTSSYRPSLVIYYYQ